MESIITERVRTVEEQEAEEIEDGDVTTKARFWKGASLQKWFQRDNLIILVLAGILLFVIALPVEDKDDSAETGSAGTVTNEVLTSQISNQANHGMNSNTIGTSWNVTTKNNAAEYGTTTNSISETSNSISNTIENNLTDTNDYADYLEKKLKSVLLGVSGVGKVSVMITLESSEELVVEKDEPVTRSNTNEEDAEGGTRVITELMTDETTIYRTEGSNSEPYVVKTILPKVEGVVVVAQGAGDGTVSKNITEMVQALFDVEVHKVKVVKMAE